jgi:LPS-assembly protein
VEPEPITTTPITPKVADKPAAVAEEQAPEPIPEPAAPAAEPKKEAVAVETAPPAETRPTPEAEAPAKAAPPAVAATPKAEVAAPEKEHAAIPETSTPASLARIDRGLDWEQCGPPVQPKAKPKSQAGTSPADARTYITADAAEVLQDEEVGIFTGNVEIQRGDELVEADEVHYNKIDDVVDARGNVFYEQPNLRFTSSSGTLNLASSQGHLDEVEYRLTDRMARGNASQADIEGRDRTHFQDISYTTCRPGNSDWVLKAAELDLDKETGTGEARHAWLSFKGVPFLYTPWATFPIDDRRKSGFLVPTIGQSDETGFDVATPYYLNLAPNYDATITPRIMGKRGLMLGGEFRYLQENHLSRVAAEILPDDNERESGESSTRGALSLQATGKPATDLTYDVDINHVSDEDYLDDFGGSLAASSARHQERRADLRYRKNNWSLLGRVQHFQTIDQNLPSSSHPYNRLPQFLAHYKHPDQPFGLNFRFDGEYVDFDQDDRVSGHRIDLHPSLSLPMKRVWGYLTPKLSARYTDYRLRDEAIGNPDSPSRFLPIFSIDGGLFFDRTTSWFDQSVEQTLEPRIFYVAIPEEDQDDIPLFDTSERGFSFANLFRENRFNGADRIGDTSQLTLAMTSRIKSKGRELIRASLGQIFYFADRDVQLRPNNPVEDDDSSAVVGELAARLNNRWSTRADVQWNPNRGDHKTEKSRFQLRYKTEEQRILNLAYRYTQKQIEQTDFSARWPIGNRFHLLARWNYSWMHDRTMEGFGGIEYDGCCWKVRTIVRNYVNGADEEANTAFFIQLELKGLTSLGSDIDSFLEEGILGYTPGN